MTENDLPQVGLPEAGTQTSPIGEAPPAGGTDATRELCYFNGVAYSPGAQVCSGGRRMQCYSNGTWGVLGTC